MSYERQNFLNGQIVTADHLNHMEDGIVAAGNVRNLLNNSDFTNPVNSDRVTSRTGNGFTVDGWYLWSDDASGNITMETRGAALNPNTATAMSLSQRFKKDSLTASAYTFAWCDYTGAIHLTNSPLHTDKTDYDYVQVYITARTVVRWAALYEGTYTEDTLPAYVPKGLHVEMINCGVALQPSNYLLNSNFTRPVNQREITSQNASGYSIDMWKFQISDGGSAGLSTSYGDVRMNATSGYVDFKQFQVNSDLLSGKKMTFAANFVNYGTLILNFTYGTSKNISSSDGNINLIHWDANQVCIRINTSTWIAVKWAALYEGTYTEDTLPTYFPKDYETELVACRRYYRKFDFRGSDPRNYALCGEYVNVPVVLDPPMRIAPSYCGSSSGRYVRVVGGSLSTTTVTYSTCSATKDSACVMMVPATEMPNTCGWVDGMIFAFSAEP